MGMQVPEHLATAAAQGEDAAWEIGNRWIAGFNRRDPDALIELAHSEFEFHPTLLVGARRTYRGHDGLRTWLADVVATSSDHKAIATMVRGCSSGDFVISGDVVLDEEVVSPFSMRFRMKDGKLFRAWAYLSDEMLLTSLGRLEAE